jgi:hypothetical protein
MAVKGYNDREEDSEGAMMNAANEQSSVSRDKVLKGNEIIRGQGVSK